MNSRINNEVEIEIDTIKHIFIEKLDSEVVSTDFINEGNSTTNYKVTTKKGTFLLKLYPPNRMNKIEVDIMRSLKSSINIPLIHVYDESRKLIGTDYLISDFIQGISLRKYVEINELSINHAKVIGETLSIIHDKYYDYPHYFDDEETPIKSISEQYDYYVSSFSGAHIGKEYCEYLEHIKKKNKHELNQIDKSSVRTHGDLNPSNILVDHNKNLWFIDFEYSQATTPYLDFGKFLRKRINFSESLTIEVLNEIKHSYQQLLPKNWIHLAMLTDITSLLGLIDKEVPNHEWISYVCTRIKDLYEEKDKFTYTFKSNEYQK